jgi:hypothetical protein
MHGSYSIGACGIVLKFELRSITAEFKQAFVMAVVAVGCSVQACARATVLRAMEWIF